MIEVQMILSLFHTDDKYQSKELDIEVNGMFVGSYSIDNIPEEIAYKLLSGIRVSDDNKITIEAY